MLFKWFSRLLHSIVFLALLFIFSHVFAPILVEASPISNAFINEIHYDNLGIDKNEFIEIAGDGSLDLTGWSLHLYNGSNGAEYNSFSFSNWSYIDTVSNFGFLTIEIKGLQNGSPDGIVLFDGESFIQFLSYEGSFKASSGIAVGLTSIDIGVSESSNSPAGFSLQLTGHGKKYSDFVWSAPQISTFGIANAKQSFIIDKSVAVSVNEPNSLPLFYLAFLILILATLKTKRVVA